MEITINIPRNDYKQPTEVRTEVVQAICQAFLKETCFRVFHPFNGSNNGCRNATRYIDINRPLFDNASQNNPIRMHGCEVAAAFKILREAGYHMYKVYSYGSWMGYLCDKKPYYNGGVEVTEFTDFID